MPTSSDAPSSFQPTPIATIGLVGGGQVSMMLAKAAKRLGCECIVLDPDPACPASQIATHHIIAPLDNSEALMELAKACDVSTFEQQAQDIPTLMALEGCGHILQPSATVLGILNDRLIQKDFLCAYEIPTAAFADLPEITQDALAAFGYPLIQKLRHEQHQGSQSAVLHASSQFSQHLSAPSFAERWIAQQKALTVLVARSSNGETMAYPVEEIAAQEQTDLPDRRLAPAELESSVSDQAQHIAIRAINALSGIGVFSIELLLTESDELLVNKVIPRIQNVAQLTADACVTDPFEQHLRAILGLPLGSTRQHSAAVLFSLSPSPESATGVTIKGLAAALSVDETCIHLYHKQQNTGLAKVGHITVLDQQLAHAKDKAQRVKDSLKSPSRSD